MSSFERIVGGTHEEKLEAARKLKCASQERDPRRSYNGSELVKSKEIILLIESTVHSVYEIAVSYGASPRKIPLDKIRLFRRDTMFAVTKGEHHGAHYDIMTAEVTIEKKKSPLSFVLTLAHELFHHASYKSAQVKNGHIAPFRSGIEVYPNKLHSDIQDVEPAFKDFEEALVVESVKIFYEQSAVKDSRFQKEISDTSKVKELYIKACESKDMMSAERRHLIDDTVIISGASDILREYEHRKNDDNFLIENVVSLGRTGQIEEFGRREERSVLHKFIDAVCVRSDGVYLPDTLLQMFLKANYSGNILHLIRTIDGILGRGECRRIDREIRKRISDLHASWNLGI